MPNCSDIMCCDENCPRGSTAGTSDTSSAEIVEEIKATFITIASILATVLLTVSFAIGIFSASECGFGQSINYSADVYCDSPHSIIGKAFHALPTFKLGWWLGEWR